MTADELAFIAAICASRDDDTPRLAYADWLEENAGGVPCPGCAEILRPDRGGLWPCRICGANELAERGTVPDGRQERAEFIRVQCELARVEAWAAKQFLVPPESREGKYLTALRDRSRSLVDSLGLDAAVGCERFQWDFWLPDVRRGFVAEITCPATDWLRHADALVWSKGQTVKCSRCDRGMIGKPKPNSVGGQWMGRMCDDCDGTGRVPRPCPETAQPVERVAWTAITRDDAQAVYQRHLDTIGRVGPGMSVVMCAEALWPGVEFALETAPVAFGTVLELRFHSPEVIDPRPDMGDLGAVNAQSFRGFPPGSLQLSTVNTRRVGGLWAIDYQFTAPADPDAYPEVDFNDRIPPPGTVEVV